MAFRMPSLKSWTRHIYSRYLDACSRGLHWVLGVSHRGLARPVARLSPKPKKRLYLELEGLETRVVPSGSQGTDSSTGFGVPTDLSAQVHTLQNAPISAQKGVLYSGLAGYLIEQATKPLPPPTNVTINWGDGTTSDASLSGQTLSGFPVLGNHTYQHVGSYPIAISGIENGQAISATNVANVYEGPLVGHAESYLTQSQDYDDTVGFFTDQNQLDTTSSFVTSIAWGDGTTSSGVVAGQQGRFNVSGSHAYAASGIYSVTMVVSEPEAGSISWTSRLYINTHAPVGLIGLDPTINLNEGWPPSSSATLDLGSFTDSDGDPPSMYYGTVDWGDGISSYARVNSAYHVIYTFDPFDHLYNEEGTYSIVVTINDVDGDSYTIDDTANVADVSVVAPWPPVTGVTATEGASTGTTILAAFEDMGDPSGTMEPVTDYSADIDWGDGGGYHLGAGTLVNIGIGQAFDVTGIHTYTDEDPVGTYSALAGGNVSTIHVRVNHEATAPLIFDVPLTLVDPPVVASAGYTIKADEGVAPDPLDPATLVTVATFTDPGDPTATVEPIGDYSATIDWGDGSGTDTGIITLSGSTYTVKGRHGFSEDTSDAPLTDSITDPGTSPFTITVTIHHETSTDTVVTDTANVAVPKISYSDKWYYQTEPIDPLDQAMATITVLLSSASDDTVTVHYETIDHCGCGSANDLQAMLDAIDLNLMPGETAAITGTDYIKTEGTLSFAPGVLTMTYNVPVLSDNVGDGDEYVKMTLTDPVNADFAGTNATEQKAALIIQDNAYEGVTTYGPPASPTEKIFPGDPPTRYWSYDSTTGKVSTYTDELGRITSYTYDSAGDLLTQTNPLGQTTTYTYNSMGEVTTVTTPPPVTGATAAVTSYAYDTLGRLLTVTYPNASVKTFTYDANGNELTETNELGKTTTFTYDSHNLLITVTDPLLHVTTYGYDTAGHQTSVTDPLGRTTAYTVDANGHVLTMTDPIGNVTTYTYNSQGEKTTETNPLGHTTTYAYSAAGRLTTVTQPDPDGAGPLTSPVTTYSYDFTTHTATVTDPLGRVTTTTSDLRGSLVGTTDAFGNAPTNTYDAALELVSTTDPFGNTTTYTYDDAGRQTSVTTSVGTTTTVYDNLGRVIAQTDMLGHTTSFVYDSRDRQIAVIDPLGHRTTTVYDAAGDVIATIDPLGRHTTFVFDAAGRQIATINPLGNTTTTVYDAAGEVVNTIDALGNTTTFAYDADGRQIAATNPLGNTSTTVYDAAGQVVNTIDALTNVTTFAYDNLGRQIAVTNPLGKTSSTVYDAGGEVVAQINPLGQPTTFVYDSHGDRTEVINPLGNITTTVYDSAGRAVATVDPLGNRTTTVYDSAGRVEETIDPLNRITTFVYDTSGRQIAVVDPLGDRTTTVFASGNQDLATIDPLGNRTSFIYDAAGRQIATENALTHFTTTVYDAASEVVNTIDALGRTTTYGYDAAGEQVTVTDPLGNVTTTTYDADGRVTMVTDPRSHSTLTTYDAAGEVVVVTDALSNSTTFTYDADGQRVSVTNALGNTTTTVYDAAGEVTESIDALSRITTFLYDDAGRQTVVIDYASNRTTTGYDAAGEVTSITKPSTNIATFTYDSAGKLATQTDFSGNKTTFIYDAAGEKIAVIDPLSHRTTSVFDGDGRQVATVDALNNRTTTVFDADGRVVNVIDALNNKTTFVYDAVRHKTEEIDSLGHTATFAYDAAGQLTASTDKDSRIITYSYDTDGRETGATWINSDSSIADVLTFTYDATGNMLTAANGNGAYTLTYDADNRVVHASEPVGTTLTMVYDAVGNRVEVQDSLGGVEDSTYDVNGNLANRAFSVSGTQLVNIGLTVDTLNRLTALTRNYGTSPALAVASTAYAYDDANRVTNLQHVDASSTNIANYTYTYDASGNLTTETRNSTTTTYTYDATNQLTGDGTFSPTYDANGNRTNTGYTVGVVNQLTSDGTSNYAYDNEGNETSKTISSTGETWTYTYDQKNELTTASHKPSTLGAVDLTATYKYDALGNRIETDVWTPSAGTVATKLALDGWKHANGHLIGNENWDVWADLDGSGSLTTRYLRGDVVDQLFARIEKSGSTWTPYWSLTDQRGSLRDVIDNSATVKDSIKYDAFGNIIAETDSSYRGRYAWTGRELEVETGLQYNRARYYDPSMARWISQDPLGFDAGDSNLYRYVKDKPTLSIDPSGCQDYTLSINPLTPYVGAFGTYLWAIQWNLDKKSENGGWIVQKITKNAKMVVTTSGTDITDKANMYYGNLPGGSNYWEFWRVDKDKTRPNDFSAAQVAGIKQVLQSLKATIPAGQDGALTNINNALGNLDQFKPMNDVYYNGDPYVNIKKAAFEVLGTAYYTECEGGLPPGTMRFAGSGISYLPVNDKNTQAMNEWLAGKTKSPSITHNLQASFEENGITTVTTS